MLTFFIQPTADSHQTNIHTKKFTYYYTHCGNEVKFIKSRCLEAQVFYISERAISMWRAYHYIVFHVIRSFISAHAIKLESSVRLSNGRGVSKSLTFGFVVRHCFSCKYVYDIFLHHQGHYDLMSRCRLVPSNYAMKVRFEMITRNLSWVINCSKLIVRLFKKRQPAQL